MHCRYPEALLVSVIHFASPDLIHSNSRSRKPVRKILHYTIGPGDNADVLQGTPLIYERSYPFQYKGKLLIGIGEVMNLRFTAMG